MNLPVPKLTTTQWLICFIAAVGFAFDIYELLMLPLIIKPALAALGGTGADGAPLLVPGTPAYTHWARMLFFVPALAGGFFGLLGGWLTDKLGRRRVLTFSILLYAVSACAAGYATSLPQLLFWRCLVFVGVCVEFVAAVAWLAEIFPNPVQREKVLGYTQAFSSLGGFMVAGANMLAASWAAGLPAIHGAHEAWRYTLVSGIIPAIPLILIRPFLPESPVWQQRAASGQLRRPSLLDLFAPELRQTTIITTLLFATSYGIAFGAIQQLPQILGMSGPGNGHAAIVAEAKGAAAKAVADAKAAGKEAPPAPKLKQISGNASDKAVAGVTTWQETGGLLGRFALAGLALVIVSRRKLFRLFQIPSLIIIPVIFWWISTQLENPGSLGTIKAAILVAGFFTVAQFSFWGNYIPLVFPVHLRGTGESFAANIGGRVLGTAAAFLTLTFSDSTPPNPAKIALVGAIVAGVYALIGAILTRFLPEPPAETEGADSEEYKVS